MIYKLKPASRLTVIFILAVILSGSVLTYFSINNISNLKELTEKKILEEQRELSARFLSAVEDKTDKVTAGFENKIIQPGLLRDSLIKRASDYDFIIQVFILKNNGQFLYPNFIGIPENPTISKSVQTGLPQLSVRVKKRNLLKKICNRRKIYTYHACIIPLEPVIQLKH